MPIARILGADFSHTILEMKGDKSMKLGKFDIIRFALVGASLLVSGVINIIDKKRQDAMILEEVNKIATKYLEKK